MEEEGRIREVPEATTAVALRRKGRACLLGLASYCGREGAERVTVIALDGAELWDGFVLEADVPALETALAQQGTARCGRTDAMHATRWSLAWTEAGQPFWLLDRKGLLAAVEGPELRLRGRPPLPAAEVEIVRATLSGDWALREVGLRLRSGEWLPLAHQEDALLRLDPTYDGLNLMADTLWVTSLARALAGALGVPLAADPDLG